MDIRVRRRRRSTPFHFDKEHNFILQIHWTQAVSMYGITAIPPSPANWPVTVSTNATIAASCSGARGSAGAPRYSSFNPGEGAYMPTTSPHMVENGDEPSVTMSFTYYTDATRRDSMLHKTHAVLRDLRINPPPVGRWPAMDALMFTGVSNALLLRELAKRLIARSRASGYARFAQVGM
jgi:hypothetical protein